VYLILSKGVQSSSRIEKIVVTILDSESLDKYLLSNNCS